MDDYYYDSCWIDREPIVNNGYGDWVDFSKEYKL